MASIFACVIFAISGSSPVTVIAVGSVMFPICDRNVILRIFSGCIDFRWIAGNNIPPSVPMIVYAIMVSNQDQQVSPNDLFVAGILPGLFIAMMLALAPYIKQDQHEKISILSFQITKAPTLKIS